MTDTQPEPEPELPAADSQEALTWLMTFDYDRGDETERRHALDVVAAWFVKSDREITVADFMVPHRGGVVRDPASFAREWSDDEPTPGAAIPRSLWPIVREPYRIMLMRAGLRLATLAAADNDAVTVALCGTAAARIFAIHDEADV